MVKFAAYLLLASAAFTLPAAAGTGPDLLLEAQIEPTQVYVQAQAVYRLRFYQAVDVSDLHIVGPSARLADIRPIGLGRIFEEVRGNRRYRVHERSYAVFPFASGALELAGAHAGGRVAVAGAQAPDGRHAISIEAPSKTLRVLAASETATPWLPAQRMTLTESWEVPDAARAGTAFKRTIRIEAAGVDAAQFPELPVVAAGIAVYAEPAQLTNRFVGELNIASRVQTFKLVPQHAGELFVPALQLRWWDAHTAISHSASLPARRLHVATDPAQTLPASAAMPDSASLPAHRLHVDTNTVQTLPTSAAPQTTVTLLYLVLVGFFCVVLFAVYVTRAYLHLIWHLYRACKANDVRGMRDGLLAWSALIWPATPPRTLIALAQHIDDAAGHDILLHIDCRIYGAHGHGNCPTSGLFRVLGHIMRQGRSRRRPA